MQVFTPVFAGGSLEDYTVTMTAWRAIISAFTADPQLAAKKRIRTTVLNPILYTIGNHGIDKARVSSAPASEFVTALLPHPSATYYPAAGLRWPSVLLWKLAFGLACYFEG